MADPAPVNKWMVATLDGLVEQTDTVFEAKFVLPWIFTDEGDSCQSLEIASKNHNLFWKTTVLTKVQVGDCSFDKPEFM